MNNLKALESYSTSRYMDPFLANEYQFECIVGGDGVTVCRGVQLLNYKLKTPLQPDTELMAVNGDYGMRFFLKSDFTAYEETQKQERLAVKAAKEQAKTELQQRLALEAKTFNESLNIPVEWKLVNKIVLSGLSQHGRGDGVNAKTVDHIQLLDSLANGRLKRNPGDLLCGANHGSFDLTAASGTAKVTCKRCLDLAQRWAENATKGNSKLYLINRHGQYFAAPAEIDIKRLEGCQIAANKEAMYQNVISEQGLDADEVVNQEILIVRDNGVWVQAHGDGERFNCDLPDGERIETYLSRLQL